MPNTERKYTAPLKPKFLNYAKSERSFCSSLLLTKNIRDMNYKTFNLIDKINAEGLDNSEWGIYMHLEEIDTKKFYGTRESFMLPPGEWIVVYEKEDTICPFHEICTPDYTVDYCENNIILFYEVN